MNIQLRILTGVAGLLLSAGLLRAGELRTWRDTSGKEIKARLVEVEWMQEMDKRGHDGKKLFEGAKALIEKHGKKA